ncbi:MAG: hypothetical protein QM368_00330 [Bacillota bacterium]|jgi:hypothetical protein|nr:hypothetical protein [Bacillota bacterium]HHU30157.1 YolD-like family protein [Bacillota bacterium]
MKNFRFPAGRVILPEFRQTALETRHTCDKVQRIKNGLELQRLIELSLQSGTVLQISLCSGGKPAAATGTIKAINYLARTIVLQTPEGLRSLKTGEIYDITELP